MNTPKLPMKGGNPTPTRMNMKGGNPTTTHMTMKGSNPTTTHMTMKGSMKGGDNHPQINSTDKKVGGGKKSKKSTKSKKSKKSKCSKPVPTGYLCCLQCAKNTKIVSSEMRKTKNNRNQEVFLCECGHTNYRFVKS